MSNSSNRCRKSCILVEAHQMLRERSFSKTFSLLAQFPYFCFFFCYHLQVQRLLSLQKIARILGYMCDAVEVCEELASPSNDLP